MTAPTLQTLRALGPDRRGVSAVTTALALSAVLGVLALGLDGASALRLHARLQTSADAAALAGAMALADRAAPEPVVQALVAENLPGMPVSVRLAPRAPDLTVALSVERALLFPQLLGLERLAISAEATAAAPRLGPACLVALGPGPRPIAGLGLARLQGCTALSVADGLSPARLAALNPFTAPAAPASRCRRGTHIVSSDEALGPGAALPARCGGVKVVAGGRLRLSGGSFHLPGPLVVEPGGRLETAGATLLAGPHPLSFEPGAEIALDPPPAGPQAGLVLLGAAGGGTSATSRLLAGDRQALGGAIVLPAQRVEIAGNTARCGMLLAQTIAVRGRTRFGLGCTPPLPQLVARQARLQA